MTYIVRFMRLAGVWETEEYTTLYQAKERYWSLAKPLNPYFRIELLNEEGRLIREWVRRWL